MNKYSFSREDFLMYESYFKRKIEQTGIIDKSVNQKHDKSFKDILINREEMSKFLEQFIGININQENLEEQKNNFINNKFQKRESDIIYKIKEKEIYILIEHQSTVDKKMPIRILEYCMEIMLFLLQNQKEKYNGNNALVIPIVIYTGKNKWNIATNFSDTQKVDDDYKNNRINLRYYLIDINKFSKKELVSRNTKLSSMMLIEKCKTREEIIDSIIKLRSMTQDEDRIIWLEKIVKFVLADILGEKKDGLLKIIERREKNEMDEWIEMVKKNDERRRKKFEERCMKKGMEKGMKEAMSQIIKNMLKLNQDEELIMKCTEAKKEEIEEIKKELGIVTN